MVNVEHISKYLTNDVQWYASIYYAEESSEDKKGKRLQPQIQFINLNRFIYAQEMTSFYVYDLYSFNRDAFKGRW